MPTEEQTYRHGVQTQLDLLNTKADMIIAQVKYTNGKVRKLIIAAVLLAGILIGQTFGNLHDIITLLSNAI